MRIFCVCQFTNYSNLQKVNTTQCTILGEVAQWLERLTASSVMHASRFRTLLFPCGVFGETAFSMWLGDHVNGGLVELRLKPVDEAV